MNIAFVIAASLLELTGVVTFAREGLPFAFMRDGAGVTWRVARDDARNPGLAAGDVISVSGEREPSLKHRIVCSRVEKTAHDSSLVPPPRIATIKEIFNELLPYGDSSWYGETICAEGLLRDINRRQASTQLLVGEDELNIQVEMPIPIETALPPNLVLGATVRVTGALAWTSIENFDAGVFGRIENVELIPADAGDVAVVENAPFWTMKRMRLAFTWLAALLGIVVAWAVTLRRMVAKRSRELAESIRLRETNRIEADAAARERLRLAADLHDGFQQYLASAVFRLKAAGNYLPENATESREQLEKAKNALQHTQSGLRSILWAMNEESEGPESLLELLRFVARRMAHWEGIVEISSEGEERKVARKSALTLLLILQEAIGNSIRHGKATRVKVKVAFENGRLRVDVADNGCGFDMASRGENGHFGLAGMERRTANLGGEMKITTAPGRGTDISFVFPD